MLTIDPGHRVRAATALEALATHAPTDRDDVVAAILVIDSEADRLGDHGLEAIGEQLRVIALLDTPKADDSIRPLLGQLAALLHNARENKDSAGCRKSQADAVTTKRSGDEADVNPDWWLPEGVDRLDRGDERIAQRRERLEQRVLAGEVDPESLLLIPREWARMPRS